MCFPTSRNSRNSCSSFHRDMTKVGSEVHWTFRFPRLGVGAGSRRLLGNQDGPVMLQGGLPSAFSLWFSFRDGQGDHLVYLGLFVGRQFLQGPAILFQRFLRLDMQYLLDTNICVFVLRQKYGVGERMLQAGVSNCFISELTHAELLYGAECSDNPEKNKAFIGHFLSRIRVIPIKDASPQNRILRISAALCQFIFRFGTPVYPFRYSSRVRERLNLEKQ